MFNLKEYLKKSSEIILSLSSYENQVNEICKEINYCSNNSRKILVAGNGGSCSDCEHFVGELQCTFKDRNRKPFSAISLPSLPAAITAWSNDFGFGSFYKRQVEAHGKEGDILFLISTGGGEIKSGASMSLVDAAKEAKKRKMKVIALIGKTGGLLKNLADISIVVKSNITSHIQESHIALLHCICEKLESD